MQGSFCRVNSLHVQWMCFIPVLWLPEKFAKLFNVDLPISILIKPRELFPIGQKCNICKIANPNKFLNIWLHFSCLFYLIWFLIWTCMLQYLQQCYLPSVHLFESRQAWRCFSSSPPPRCWRRASSSWTSSQRASTSFAFLPVPFPNLSPSLRHKKVIFHTFVLTKTKTIKKTYLNSFFH